jgi:hypothetical protein
MAEETTIIEIEFGNSLKNIQELNREIERLKREQKELKDQGKENSEQYIKNASDIRVLTSEVRENTKVIDNVNKSYQAGTGSIKQLRAELSIAKKAYSELSAEERDNEQIGGQLLKQTSDLNSELKKLESAYGNNKRSVGGYKDGIESAVVSIDSLRNRVKELKDESTKLDLNSKEYKEARNEAAKLELQIDQALGKVNEFGNREPKNPAKKAFDDAVISAVTLGSTVKLLSDTFVESEDSQKALAKAVQGFAIAQTVANIVKEKGAILDTANLVVTKAQTAAQVVAATVTRLLASATAQFGITATAAWAAATLGVSLLIAGIIALIANFDRISNKLKEFFGLQDTAKEAAEKLTKEYQNQLIELDKQVKSQELIGRAIERAFDKQIKLAKAAGKETAALEAARFKQVETNLKQQLTIQLKQLEIQKQLALTGGGTAKAYIEQSKAVQKLKETLDDLQTDFQVKQLEAETKAREKATKAAEDFAKKQTEFIQKRDAEIKRVAKLERELANDLALLAEARTKKEQEETQKRIDNERKELEQRSLIAQQFGVRLSQLQEGLTEDAAAQYLATTQAVVEQVNLLGEFFGVTQQGLFDKYQEQLEVNGDLTFENFVAQQTELLSYEQQVFQQRAALAQQFATQVGDLLADAITDSEASLEDFSRGLTLLILDTLEKQIQAAIAGAIAQEIGTKGVAGIVTGAIAAAAVRTAFGVAKNQLSRPPKGFATGVVGLNGPGTETSDSIPAWLSKGESVITASGTDWFQSHYPGLLEFANSNHKFATGVVDFNPEPSVSGELSIIDAIRALPNPVVRVSDIDKGFNDVRTVQVTGQIG